MQAFEGGAKGLCYNVLAIHTAHDARMREAVTNLKWPLVQPFEAAPLRAGSIVLYSHNMFIEATITATTGTPGKTTRASCGVSGSIAPPIPPAAMEPWPRWIGTALAWAR